VPTYGVTLPRFGLGRPTNQPVLNPEWPLGANFAALIDDRSGYNLVNRAAPGTITGTKVSGVSPPISLSRGYGPNVGNANGDLLTTGFSGQVAQRTFAAWVYRVGAGQFSVGQVFASASASTLEAHPWGRSQPGLTPSSSATLQGL
jgi:hypothetical protein